MQAELPPALAASESGSLPGHQLTGGRDGIFSGIPLIFFLFLVVAVPGCRFGSSSPAGEYTGSWREPDQSTVLMTLTLAVDGKAMMQRTVRWPDGRTEADSWESEYRVGEDRVLIGSEGKVYAVFRRQGNALLDQRHLADGKPIRLERKAAKSP
ncbi:hypothetical protein [Verrucomicrobium sp. 3C]|uniref:hypothetical protein n=1 Tax=Verrucomicrobium sp. 3C TaxID=1134055 RepID=UPI0003A05B69|nr:hypothetical protein [Verrucomicrobium sp. 3C]